jgi:hypothetical protein
MALEMNIVLIKVSISGNTYPQTTRRRHSDTILESILVNSAIALGSSDINLIVQLLDLPSKVPASTHYDFPL